MKKEVVFKLQQPALEWDWEDIPNTKLILDSYRLSHGFRIRHTSLFLSGYVCGLHTQSVLADESLAAVRRLSEVEPMRGSSLKGAQCVNSLVTATCLLLLPSSMASMTSSGWLTKRSVHPWRHMQSQGDAVFSSPAAGWLHWKTIISSKDHDLLYQADAFTGKVKKRK